MLPGFLGALQAVSHLFLLTHLGQSAVQRTCSLTLRIFHVDEVSLTEAEVHSLLAAVQLCSRQILGVLTAVPPGSLACRHLHGLCWHEVCIHCVCTAMDLGVPPSACPGSQRWGCVLYVLQHGSVLCISTFCVFCSPETCQTSH